MVDYKFIVERFQFYSALCSLGVWHRGTVNRGFIKLDTSCWGVENWSPRGRCLRSVMSMGKGADGWNSEVEGSKSRGI